MSRPCLAVFFGFLMVFATITSGVANLIEDENILNDIKNNNTSFNVINKSGFQAGSIFSDTSVAAGDKHTCAILETGSLKCWGDNQYGQLGIPFSHVNTEYENIVDLGEGTTAIAVATGAEHTCAIISNGSLKCWGGNMYGQIGTPSSGNQLTPLTVDLSGKTVVAVEAGGYHTCVILDDSSVRCWGYNIDRQTGSNHQTWSPPVEPQLQDTGNSNYDAVAISLGWSHSCAILGDGSVKCWGSNSVGAIGVLPVTSYHQIPQHVNLGENRTAVAILAEGYFSCAILDNGFVKCWGSNQYGQLGYESSNGGAVWFPQEYVDLGENKTAISIAGGWGHTCVILNDSSLKCWGANSFGQLGIGYAAPNWTGLTTPQTVNLGNGSTALAVAAGLYWTCAVLDDKSMKCWGDNQQGQLGIEWSNNTTYPQHVISTSNNEIHHIDISERDFDGDGILNIFDTHILGDSDGDGFSDNEDSYPNNPTRSQRCPAGTYGRHYCENTSAGNFSNYNSMFQELCGHGYFQPNYGQISCLPSSPGHYVNQSGAHSQKTCSAGFFQGFAAQITCNISLSGHYVPLNDRINMIACIPGTYQPANGQTSCIDTDPGYYTNDLAQTIQMSCYIGHYQPYSGQTSCFATDPGYYSNFIAQTTQKPCDIGTYQPNSGRATCVDASQGHYVSHQKQTEQSQCSPGTFQPLRGSVNCIPSPVNHYVEIYAATSAQQCPTDTIQPIEGQTTCIEADSDGDGIGDIADLDDDNDGVNDIFDIFKYDPSEWDDNDEDGIGDNADLDDDNDGFLDINDFFPYDSTEWNDNDGDGIGDNADLDDDNDGVRDIDDYSPLNPMEWADTDKDGIEDNTDEDDDNDGWLDFDEISCDTNPHDIFSYPSDIDDDGICDKIDTDADGDGFSNNIEKIFLADSMSANDKPSLSSPIVISLSIFLMMLVTYRRREKINTILSNSFQYFVQLDPKPEMIGVKKGNIEWLVFDNRVWSRNILKFGNFSQWNINTQILVPDRRMVGVIDDDGREYLFKYGVLWIRIDSGTWALNLPNYRP